MKKISVMIVDDEKLVIEDLTTIVDWEAHGFEIVATAVNGRQALSKFQQLRPQVVITDIKMPFMDGIELIEHLREKDKQTLIVVLTAYEDFNYAKTAIHHGIMDYVIKSTIDGPTASNLLERIRAQIESRDQMLDILKNKQIEDFFNSDQYEIPLAQKELFRKPYCYLLVEQNMPLNLSGDYNIDYVRFRKADAIAVLLEGDSTNYNIVAVSSTPRNQILVVLDIPKNSRKELQQICYQCALEKKNILQERLQVELSLFIVSDKMSLMELKQCYEAKRQYFNQKYIEYKEIYDLENLQDISTSTQDLILDEKQIDVCIEKRDEAGLERYLTDLFYSIDTYAKLHLISRALYDLLKSYCKRIPEYTIQHNLSFISRPLQPMPIPLFT